MAEKNIDSRGTAVDSRAKNQLRVNSPRGLFSTSRNLRGNWNSMSDLWAVLRHQLCHHWKRRPEWANALLYGLLGLLVIFASVAVFTYVKYSSMLQTRLAEGEYGVSAVYSRPLELSVGQSVDPKQFKHELRGLGYGVAQENENWLTIEPGGGTAPVKIELEGRPDKIIKRIEQAGETRERVQLATRFLSPLRGKPLDMRKYVRYEDLPEVVKQAVLSAEDEGFFEHSGVDVRATLRAAYINFLKSGIEQGASTLTQQFVKNFFLTPERTISRKVKEAILSIILEGHLSKEQIFELYVNEVYMGQVGPLSLFGLATAAESFFGKDLSQLSLAEAALLAGMIQAPNRYSPIYDKLDTRERRNYILSLMYKNRFISADELKHAESEPIEAVPIESQEFQYTPYFVDFVRDSAEVQAYQGRQVNLRIHTTMEPALQKAAYRAIERGVKDVDEKVSRREISKPQVALVAVDPKTGELLALIGGRNYLKSQLNRAVEAKRQPGSTFKPFVYGAALEDRGSFNMASILRDEPTRFEFNHKTYEPSNYGDEYRGEVNLRDALSSSLNVPTVRLAEDLGFRTVVSFAQRLGINERVQPYPSTALGAFEVTLLELARAYTPFANGGKLVHITAVRHVEVNGKEVPVNHPDPTPVLDPEVAFLVTSALQTSMNSGTAYRARRLGFRLPAAGKTGTSNDSWFVGYTPDLLCAVWVGIDSNSDLDLTGSRAALPIWTYFMQSAQKLGYLTGKDFSPPKGIVTAKIDPATGLLFSSDCEEVRTEYFIKGTAPTKTCDRPHGLWFINRILPDFEERSQDHDENSSRSDRQKLRSQKMRLEGLPEGPTGSLPKNAGPSGDRK